VAIGLPTVLLCGSLSRRAFTVEVEVEVAVTVMMRMRRLLHRNQL
jgi:hypothetical protein